MSKNLENEQFVLPSRVRRRASECRKMDALGIGRENQEVDGAKSNKQTISDRLETQNFLLPLQNLSLFFFARGACRHMCTYLSKSFQTPSESFHILSKSLAATSPRPANHCKNIFRRPLGLDPRTSKKKLADMGSRPATRAKIIPEIAPRLANKRTIC